MFSSVAAIQYPLYGCAVLLRLFIALCKAAHIYFIII